MDPLAAVATDLGLTVARVLVRRPGRAVAQAIDQAGNRRAVKVAAEADAFAGDVHANAVLSELGLPVPTIVLHRAGPPAVLVLDWIDGEAVSSASPVSARREAGRLLRLIHDQPGGPPFSGQPTVAGWIAEWTAELTTWWPGHGGSRGEAAHLVAWCDRLRPTLARRPGSLALFDGRPEHFLVHHDSVAGLIDLHDLGPGDPAMDLAVLTLHDEALLPAVLDGYEATDEERVDFNLVVPFLRQLRRLAAAEWQARIGRQG